MFFNRDHGITDQRSKKRIIEQSKCSDKISIIYSFIYSLNLSVIVDLLCPYYALQCVLISNTTKINSTPPASVTHSQESVNSQYLL